MNRTLEVSLALALLLSGMSPAFADDDGAPKFSGNCSWYGPGFNGKKTASGEIFDMSKSTAAHRKLSFGTKVLVEHPKTGKTVIVKVNDRGPYAKGRVMDLSRGAAQKLGILLGGVTYLECTVLPKDSPTTSMNIDVSPPQSQSFVAMASATAYGGELNVVDTMP